MKFRRTVLHSLTWLTFGLLIVFLANPLDIIRASGDKGSKRASAEKGRLKPSNFDVLAESPQRNVARLNSISGASRVQTESRFAVPTFLWAAEPGPARRMRKDAVGKGIDQAEAARSHLSRYAGSYRLSRKNISDAVVRHVHDTGFGAIIVKFGQTLGGVEVFRDEVSVAMNRDLQLIAISGYLTGDKADDPSPASRYRIQPEDALAIAIGDLTGSSVDKGQLTRLGGSAGKRGGKTTDDPYTRFSADKGAFSGFHLSEEPSRTKPVMFHVPDRYIPAYYVETAINMPSSNPNVLDANGNTSFDEWGYSFVISAEDGSVLFRKDQVSEQAYSYRVFADPVTKMPYDGPAGNSVHPKVNPAPDGVQYPFVSAMDVTLQNFPFSKNDPWLPAGATETVGNNVDAFVNLYAPDGYGDPTTTTPTDNPAGDFRGQLTGANAFLNTHVVGNDTGTAAARQGSIQQLFYNINFLHDWFYDAGFDEASGNAQTDNYGRGGLGNDNIKGQVQDSAGFSNANMLTPSDGGRPRMRMYNFPSLANHLNVTNTPAAGLRGIGIGALGPQFFDVTAEIVVATFSATPTCAVTNAAALNGKIAMFDFQNNDGTGCAFGTRVVNLSAQTDAAAILMVYQSTTPTSVANVTGFNPAWTKPFGVISWNSAVGIKEQIAASNPVTARLFRDANRDGSLDNQIVSHEWGHYISNRLIGNANGLSTNMSGGLGEGWGDFTALLLSVREDDTLTPSNTTWNGVYSMGTYATSGVNPLGVGNNGYYFAIRRIPYSTDMSINPLTYRHISNGVPLPVGPPIAFGQDGVSNAQVHNTGEIWANMMWESYAALLRDTQGPTPRLTFAEAQNRMKNYVVGGYKLTPSAPTLLEARDAVIAAALANDPADAAAIGRAFAKRGAGIGALPPADRFSSTNAGLTESFHAGGDIRISNISLTDNIVSHDNDGYLDRDEIGTLSMTVTNTGYATLDGITVTASTTTSGYTFPNGPTASAPAVAPFASQTVNIAVQGGSVSGPAWLNFNLSADDPGEVPAPSTATFTDIGNVDEFQDILRVDSFESKDSKWTASSNPSLNQSPDASFRRRPEAEFQYEWFIQDSAFGTDQYMTLDPVTVNSSGSLNVQWDHRFVFESDSGGNYDGGVIEMSVNGGSFTDIGAGAYNGTLINYAGNINPLAGRPAFVGNSGGVIHSSVTTAVAPGSTVQIRFRFGSDVLVGAEGWHIDNVGLSGIVESPFAQLVSEAVPGTSNTIQGKVVNEFGRGVSGAGVTIVNADGVAKTVRTNSFGVFTFTGVQSAAYLVQTSARGSYARSIIEVNGNLSNLMIEPE